MFRYGNYIVVIEPDYKKMLRNHKECDEYWCRVYDKNDIKQKNCLCEFNMMPGFEFDDHTKKSIEEGIKKLVDESYSTIQLELCEKELTRQKELLTNSIRYISRLQQGKEFYRALHNEIGMTNEEISEQGFDSLSEYFVHEEDNGMDLSQ